MIGFVLKEPYKETTLINECMTGGFPVLKLEANAVRRSGTVTCSAVQPHRRYLLL